MKKGIILKISIFALILILIFTTILYYSDNIKSLKNLLSPKKSINEKKTEKVVDVTGIELGKEAQHEHIYKTIYDETNHWEECTVCQEKRNEKKHTITTTWANRK